MAECEIFNHIDDVKLTLNDVSQHITHILQHSISTDETISEKKMWMDPDFSLNTAFCLSDGVHKCPQTFDHQGLF